MKKSLAKTIYQKLPKTFKPGIAWFFLVCVLLFMPSKAEVKPISFLDKIHFDKWVHLGLFMVFSFLFAMPIIKKHPITYKKNLLFMAIILIGFAYSTELIQRWLANGRDYDIFDWVADIFGILYGIVLALIVRKQYHKAL